MNWMEYVGVIFIAAAVIANHLLIDRLRQRVAALEQHKAAGGEA